MCLSAQNEISWVCEVFMGNISPYLSLLLLELPVPVCLRAESRLLPPRAGRAPSLASRGTLVRTKGKGFLAGSVLNCLD